jgi:hypothetical protein
VSPGLASTTGLSVALSASLNGLDVVMFCTFLAITPLGCHANAVLDRPAIVMTPMITALSNTLLTFIVIPPLKNSPGQPLKAVVWIGNILSYYSVYVNNILSIT